MRTFGCSSSEEATLSKVIKITEAEEKEQTPIANLEAWR